MKKWEYKSVKKICASPDFDAEFNELGKEGWEMVAALLVKTNFDSTLVPIFIFKREIPAQAKQPMDLSEESPVRQALRKPISLLTPKRIEQLQQRKKPKPDFPFEDPEP